MACADWTVRLVLVDRILTAPDATASSSVGGKTETPSRSTSHSLSAAPVSLIWSTPLVVSWPCHAASLLASSKAGLGGWGAADAVIDAHASELGSSFDHCSLVSIGSGLMDVRSPCLVSSWTNASLASGLARGGGAVRNGTAAPRSSRGAPASDDAREVHVAAMVAPAAARRRARTALIPPTEVAPRGPGRCERYRLDPDAMCERVVVT